MNNSKYPTCLTVLFLALSIICSAQLPYDFQWGPVNKDLNKRERMLKIAAAVDGNFISVRQKWGSKDGGILLVLHDQNMKLVKTAPLELTNQGNELTFSDVAVAGRKLYVFAEWFDKQQKKLFCFASLIDPETLAAVGDPVQVGEIPKGAKTDPERFGFSLSSDSIHTKILVHGAYLSAKERRANLFVWDHNLQPLWKKEATIPAVDPILNQFKVDDAGNAFLLSTIEKARSKGNEHSILIWRNEGKDFKEYKVAIEPKYVKDVSIQPLQSGDLICAGYYADDPKGSTKGLFFYAIDAGGTQQPVSFKPFEDDLLAALSDDKSQNPAFKDNDPELYDYFIKALLPRTDGSVVVVGEHQIARDMMSSLQTVFLYGNLIVANISPDRQIDWIRLVPKSQLSADIDGGSFVLADAGEQLHFVYFQTPNLGQPDIKMTTIHPDGKTEEFVVALKMKGNIGMKFRPNASMQINLKTVVLYTEDTSDYRYGSLKFH